MFFETLAVAALALGASAQSATITSAASGTGSGDASAQTTISAFVGSGLEGSIVTADGCSTVLAVACGDDSSNPYCAQVAEYGAVELTITEEPSAIEFGYSTSTEGASIGLSASCDLLGSSPTWTAEVCTITAVVSISGSSTTTSTQTTVTSDFSQEALAITAGAEKLPSAGATCSADTTNAAAPTAMSQVYKVLVPVGAAVIGAGAFL